MLGYRIGVSDDQADGVTLWHDMESAAAAYTAWRLLRDYGRPGVKACLQLRIRGQWTTVDPLGLVANPPLITRPHDWPHDNQEGRHGE